MYKTILILLIAGMNSQIQELQRDLEEMGFNTDHIKVVTQITTDKEEAINL